MALAYIRSLALESAVITQVVEKFRCVSTVVMNVGKDIPKLGT